tara:strand:- start:2942 stop:4486 length:1545 start_codon:yes stop_codon:yes gene_type:complete
MPGEPIQVGPFVGGLNTFSDPTAIADNELVVCENFELDLDGSLKSRPPIQNLSINFPLAATGDINFLGNFQVSETVSYLLASDGDSKTYYFNGTTWVLITSTMAAAGFVQFDDKAWLTAPVGAANPGGYWTVSGGFVADANMPKGNVIVAFKGRLWIAEGKDSTNQGTRLYRSRTTADPLVWPVAQEFVDIGTGDGQNIVQLVVYFNSLLIFRTNSVYGLQYTSDPAAAVVSLILPTVGLNSKYAIAQFESYIYFMYDEKAYEFTNNRAAQINVKTPFEATATTGLHNNYAVSEFNKRIVFTYFDEMFVYSLQTRSWTKWESAAFGSLGKMLPRINNEDKSIILTHSNAAVAAGAGRVAPLLQITDEYGTAAETMTCQIQTKNFNYQASGIYKRLFWWGLDARFKGTVVGTAVPITQTFTVSWQTLYDTSTWAAMLGFTWQSPTAGTGEVSTSVTESALTFKRIFVKFLKSLRFRQIYYKVVFTTTGIAADSPVRLFSLTTYVNAKQTVSKEIT